jgi:hypothetical protein
VSATLSADGSIYASSVGAFDSSLLQVVLPGSIVMSVLVSSMDDGIRSTALNALQSTKKKASD